MHPEELTNGVEIDAITIQKTLMIAGPQPPPTGGATILVQAVLDELAKHNPIRVIPINTSPPPESFSAKKVGLNLEKIQRMAFIIRKYFQNIKHSDAVLVFASSRSTFFIAYIPLLLLLTRWHHKPFYLKPFGGALDLYLAAQRKPVRSYLLSILHAVDGVLVETKQLQAALIQLGLTNTHYVPGCRSAPEVLPSNNRDSKELRLIFLSLIHRQKGAMILLEALGILARVNDLNVSCDFYGPILEDREEFLRQLEAAPNSHYCGELQPGTASDVIAAYDVLVLPTFAPTEGHPGAIIEAMQAGIPVISTRLRAIPELITDGENGFLVPTQDSHALAEAIKRIALDSSLRERMGEANYRRGKEFCPEVVVPQILDIIFHRKETDMPL
jgi:glycosyltransferase involved in cell wall biosynthesis